MTARISLLFLASALALSACGQGAQTPQPVGLSASASPEDRLVAAIEAEGCALTSGNVGSVLLRANLTQAALPALTDALAKQGRLAATDGSALRVLSPNCA